MCKIIYLNNEHLFVEDNGAVSKCKYWLEKDKAKIWIKLPNGNSTNRTYFSLVEFNTNCVNNELEIKKKKIERNNAVKGIKKNILDKLDDSTKNEYILLVDSACRRFESMKKDKNIHSFIDVFTEEEYKRYNEILEYILLNKKRW